MDTRTIQRIIPAQKVNMGGHLIDQPLPNKHMDQFDPFLLIHHVVWELEGQQKQQDLGVAPHPHRGFSPVTFVFEGEIRHQDSFGHDEVVKAGGTQWMHAGKGITHSERPSKAAAEAGGKQEFIQFWINSPAQYKMETPHYQPLKKSDIPHIEDDRHSIQVVAGTYDGITGPAKTFSPLILLRGSFEVDTDYSFEIPKNYNTLLYVLSGDLSIGDQHIADKILVSFHNDGTAINIKAHAQTRFILLSGEPIGEEITSYGPFVMNNQTEIMEAFRDARMGKMGVLIENFEK